MPEQSSPQHKLYRGPNLERVLDRVRRHEGPDAKIVKAEKIRQGGFGGFFANEYYQVTVDIGGGSAAPVASSVSDAASAEASSAARPLAAGADELLRLADEMKDRNDVTSLAGGPDWEGAEAFARVLGRLMSEGGADEGTAMAPAAEAPDMSAAVPEDGAPAPADDAAGADDGALAAAAPAGSRRRRWIGRRRDSTPATRVEAADAEPTTDPPEPADRTTAHVATASGDSPGWAEAAAPADVLGAPGESTVVETDPDTRSLVVPPGLLGVSTDPVEQQLVALAARMGIRSLRAAVADLAQKLDAPGVDTATPARSEAARSTGHSGPAVVLFVAGATLGSRPHVVVVGIDVAGAATAVAVAPGSTENPWGVRRALAQIAGEGAAPVLAVTDGSIVVATAIRREFPGCRVQRCLDSFVRSVEACVPRADRRELRSALRAAIAEAATAGGGDALEVLAAVLADDLPSVADQLRRGADEVLTVANLGVADALTRSLSTTALIRRVCRAADTGDVAPGGDWQVAVRQAAVGLPRLPGHRQLDGLVRRLAREAEATPAQLLKAVHD